MKTLVSKLKPGDAFRVDMGSHNPLDYRLIRVNNCRAYVEPLRRQKQIDILEDSPGGRVNISPNCECEQIDEELETIMKSATMAKETTTKTTKATVTKRRSHDPGKQERPIREGTVRAKLLAALESGNVNIPKLMKELDMLRPLLLSHIHELWRCHGYGYSITDDVVKLVKPVGGAMKVVAKSAKKAKKTKSVLDSIGKTFNTNTPALKDPFDDEDDDPLS